MSKIKLDYGLALALGLWRQDGQRSSVPAGDGSKLVEEVLLLAGAPPDLIDYLLQELGAESLLVTSKGPGFLASLVYRLWDSARVVIRSRVMAEQATNLDGGFMGSGQRALWSLVKERSDAEVAVPPLLIDVEKRKAECAAQAPVVPVAFERRPGCHEWNLGDRELAKESRGRASLKHSERIELLHALEARPVRNLPLATRDHVERMRGMKADFPNFSELIDSLSRDLVLQVACAAPLRLPPTLLQGAPGLGKTVFAMRMAEALGFHFEMRTLADMTAGFVLTGNTSSWAESQSGLIARMLIRMPDGRSPLLLLDELDKSRGDSSFPPDKVLLGMLEDSTAGRFRDEHLEVDLDVSPMSFMFTANDPRKVRAELRSRLQVVEIRPPSQEQMPAIVRSVDKELRARARALESVCPSR